MNNINNRHINIICNYASIYGGNFIPSLLSLSKAIANNYSIIFTFPSVANDRNWFHYIESLGYKAFFYSSNKFNHFKKEIKQINRLNNVCISYFHFFSGLKAKSIYPYNKRMKIMIHIHSDFTGGNGFTIKNKVLSFIEALIRKDSTYIYVSEKLFSKSSFMVKYYVPNALCLQRIPCKSLDVNQIISDNDISTNDTVFLVFGWSPFIKGIDVVIKAFMNVPDNKQKNAKLLVVHGRDNGYQKCISFLVDRIGNSSFLSNKNIIFIKPTEDVFSLYSLADVYISSSRSEGFSYSLLEAIYFNLFSLVSNIEGTSWSLNYHNVNSYAVENYSELSSLMCKLVGKKKVEGKNNVVNEDYSIVDWVNNINNIIEEI